MNAIARKFLVSRRSLGMIALASAAAVGLSACGDSSREQKGTATSGDITWWGWTPDAANAAKLIAEFNREYPEIHVEFVSKPIDSYDSVLSPAITSKDGPDVFNVAPGSANGGVQVYEGGAIDLTSAVTQALGEDWRSQLAQIGVNGLTVGEKLVGLSAGAVYSGGLWVNQDLFDRYGLSHPTTFEEWKAVCAKFESHGVGGFVQGAGQHAFDMDTYEAIMENIRPGSYMAAAKGEIPFTDPIFKQGLDIWRQLFDEGIMQEGAIGLQQYPDANNAFMAGKYAMIMMGSWYTQYAVKDSMVAAMEAAGVSHPEPFTMLPIDFPDVAGTGEVGHYFGDADYGVAVSGMSDQQAAATTFATWLATSEQGQQAVADTLNDVPALSGISPDWEAIDLVNPEVQRQPLQDYTAKVARATSTRFADVSSDLNSTYKDGLIGLVAGEMDAEELLSSLQAVVDAQG
ncbi:ABC transporter substrate-binding protein [Actinomyces faecalis]|uniref:ABC transporter substrate-binding protein n=1 Tax=Actinomyces faecalis TaxID=2722820 RepID=UPI0015531188|nr:ABC transporter substrate-binding protein [Actinomyces faecalis]